MKFHILFFLAIIILFTNTQPAPAQVDSVIGQLTASLNDSFGGGISGNGRLVVFESTGNLATENPRNADLNREIFLFDYAQRRIFQITDTKSLLTDTTRNPTFDNIKVDIINVRPVISNDGLWIAFSSNATYAYPGNGTIPPIVSASNPGNFDANSFTDTMGNNNLVNDGNTELWMYQIPPLAPADMTTGEEIPVTDLSAGTFTRATNTIPSRLPSPGDDDPPTIAVVAGDNTDASITDNGSHVAFVSNRDLEPGVGNSFPNDDNDEIYVFNRTAGTLEQITKTPRTPPSSPTKNLNPTISTLAGGNLRVVFYSNANNPIDGMTGGTNSDRNNEIFYADLDPSGNPSLTKKQITSTTGNPGQTLNILNFGRRMSRDGTLIAFDSYADLANEHAGANQTGFALFLYDVAANSFRRIGPRSTADSAATGGDVARYPGFTDNSVSGAPSTLVLETRMNIKPDGTIPTNQDDGLNPNTTRPAQVYSYPLNVAPASATFTRLTKLPTPFFELASAQPLPSDSVKRMGFTLALSEIGTGNLDFGSEVYYMLQPDVIRQSPASFSFSTGASRIPVTNDPVPTPSPTATPTATPTPTPQTPPAVQGVSPGMLAILDYQTGFNNPIVAREAVGSLDRRFTLPIQLSGVTMTIGGAACGLKRVSQRQIVFVVPPALSINATTLTFSYPVVINNNGTVIKGTITLVPGRPDIFTDLPTPGPGGRTRILNVTNYPFQTGEPFTVRTIKRRGSRKVPTVLRVYLTGVNFFARTAISIRVGSQTITGASILTDAVEREPGVFTIDFTLPPELDGAGDVPIIVTVNVGGTTFSSRLDDTASRFRIL